MNPTPGDLHVNVPLTNLSIQYVVDQSQFIADKVFPNVPVTNQGNIFRTYARADWMRAEAQERAPATESAGGGWRVGQDTYFAKVWAIHKDVDDQTRGNADAPFNLDRDATAYVTHQLLLRRELLWAAKFFQAGVWGTELAGVSGSPSTGQVKQWDQAGSTPIEDVEVWRVAMAEATGYIPNTLVISPRVISTLKNHAEILDRIKYTQRGQITLDLIASLFEVDRVFVPYVTQNTAVEGRAGSYSFIYGKHALLCYVPPNAGLNTVSAGYTFSWTGYVGAGNMGNRIKSFRMEPIASDRIEGEMAFDMKVIATDLGIFYNGLIA